ncbi:hypothetical protein UT300012_23240 [Paraclostridium bifermentans]
MEEFKQQLVRALSSHKNIQFVIVVNHRLIRTDTYFGLATFDENEELILGIKKANIGMIAEQDVEDRMRRELFRDYYHGIDLSNTNRAINRKFYIDVDPQTRVVHITTSVHRLALELLNHDGLDVKLNNNRTGELDIIDAGKLFTFKREFTLEMYDKYEMSVRLLLERRFNRRKALKFYKTGGAFLGVYYVGKFLYNPLYEIKEIRDKFEQTKMWQLMQATGPVVVYDINVYYLTHKEICECLNLNTFITFNFEFLSKLVFDKFVPGLINSTERVYIYTGAVDGMPLKISQEEYDELGYKSDYISATEFSYLCIIAQPRRASKGLYYNTLKDYSLALAE